jgi:hypothetical protein
MPKPLDFWEKHRREGTLPIVFEQHRDDALHTFGAIAVLSKNELILNKLFEAYMIHAFSVSELINWAKDRHRKFDPNFNETAPFWLTPEVATRMKTEALAYLSSSTGRPPEEFIQAA